MNRKITTILLLLSIMLFSSAAHANVIGIASGRQGSLGYNTGVAVTKILNTQAKMVSRLQPMAGTAVYIPLINRGEMDFGFCNAVEAKFSYSGTGNFEGQKNPNLRAVALMFPLRTGLMVVADSGIKTIADVYTKRKSLRVSAEYTASSIIKYYIAGALANGGMTYDDLIKVPVSSFVEGMMALGEGKVDLTLISLGSGASHKVNTKLHSRGGIRYVSLDASPEGVARFKKYLPAAEIFRMEANKAFPGLQEPANIVKIPWMMMTYQDLSEETVYKVTKTIAENLEALGKAFGAFKLAKLKDLAPEIQVPYHPGALKYYKEAGVSVGK